MQLSHQSTMKITFLWEYPVYACYVINWNIFSHMNTA